MNTYIHTRRMKTVLHGNKSRCRKRICYNTVTLYYTHLCTIIIVKLIIFFFRFGTFSDYCDKLYCRCVGYKYNENLDIRQNGKTGCFNGACIFSYCERIYRGDAGSGRKIKLFHVNRQNSKPNHYLQDEIPLCNNLIETQILKNCQKK